MKVPVVSIYWDTEKGEYDIDLINDPFDPSEEGKSAKEKNRMAAKIISAMASSCAAVACAVIDLVVVDKHKDEVAENVANHMSDHIRRMIVDSMKHRKQIGRKVMQ